MFSEQTFYFWRVVLDLDNFCLGTCVSWGIILDCELFAFW